LPLHVHADAERIGQPDDDTELAPVHLVGDLLAPLLAHAAVNDRRFDRAGRRPVSFSTRSFDQVEPLHLLA
jgi:hypothetical protein